MPGTSSTAVALFSITISNDELWLKKHYFCVRSQTTKKVRYTMPCLPLTTKSINSFIVLHGCFQLHSCFQPIYLSICYSTNRRLVQLLLTPSEPSIPESVKGDVGVSSKKTLAVQVLVYTIVALRMLLLGTRLREVTQPLYLVPSHCVVCSLKLLAANYALKIRESPLTKNKQE